MSDSKETPGVASQCSCCISDLRDWCRMEGLTRREFLAGAGSMTAAGVASPAIQHAAANRPDKWQRQQPIRIPLKVQPVFIYETYERKPARSWRWTGGIQDEQEADEEKERVRRDLNEMISSADFPIELLSLTTVRNADEATAVPKGNYDVLIMYATRRNPKVMEVLAAPDKWNLIFVRYQTGPTYYMYIGAHAHFFRKTRDKFGQPGMDIQDFVVDDAAELLWRLRALYGLKNILGKRIVAVGGPGGWGAEGDKAPDRARELWNLDIRTVSYPDLDERIQRARRDKTLVERCQGESEKYLKKKGVFLDTARHFVDNAFVLCEVFRDLLDEAKTDAITVNNCMSTIMPISETTACLPLTLLNDEGYMAFCESDFVVIPSGILLHYISGTPVFLCNPSFPHNDMMTVSHCTAPRKMDGKRLEPVKILTHYESDYGAAPKVEMRKGQKITVINPDFASQRWLGIEGEILDTPFHPICRTQLDVRIRANSERLAEEMRGFHLMVTYGNYLREVGYALKKVGVEFLKLA